MNSNVMPSRVRMEPNLLQQLTAEVKETVDALPTTAAVKQSSFKAIDLWNIQRRGRFTNSGTKRKKNAFISLTHVAF